MTTAVGKAGGHGGFLGILGFGKKKHEDSSAPVPMDICSPVPVDAKVGEVSGRALPLPPPRSLPPKTPPRMIAGPSPHLEEDSPPGVGRALPPSPPSPPVKGLPPSPPSSSSPTGPSRAALIAAARGLGAPGTKPSVPIPSAPPVAHAAPVAAAAAVFDDAAMTNAVLERLLLRPIRDMGSKPSDKQLAVVYDNIMRCLPSETNPLIVDAARREGLKKCVMEALKAHREESHTLGAFLVNSGKASSFADAGARYLVPSNGIADALGCEVFRQLQQGEFERENAAFEARYLKNPSTWDPLYKFFASSVYKNADTAVEKCVAYLDHDDSSYRDICVGETNFVIQALNLYLRNPFCRGMAASDIRKGIMSKLPSSAFDDFAEADKADTRKRVKNIVLTYYREYLARLGVKEEDFRKGMVGGVADALACGANREVVRMAKLPYRL